MTENTMLLTPSEPVRPDCEIMVASTAAASPRGIIIDRNALSLLLTLLMSAGNEILTIGILKIIKITEIPSPINNEIKLSNLMEMPTYTKKKVFIKNTSSLNNVFSIGLSRVGFLLVNLVSHLWCMRSILANPIPNAKAEIIPLYPNSSLIPYMMKTKAGVVKMELLMVLTLSSTNDQNIEPSNPIMDASKNDEKTCPKMMPILNSPYLYDSKMANATTMQRIALNADSSMSMVLLFSPMLICLTKGIATADDDPPKAAPNMKLMPGFIPKASQPRAPIAINVIRKFTIVKVTVFLMESAKVLNDSSVPLSNKSVTSVSCPKTFPMELSLSASTTFKRGPIIMPIITSIKTSGILFLLNISANQCAAKTKVPNVNISNAGSIAKFFAKIRKKDNKSTSLQVYKTTSFFS